MTPKMQKGPLKAIFTGKPDDLYEGPFGNSNKGEGATWLGSFSWLSTLKCCLKGYLCTQNGNGLLRESLGFKEKLAKEQMRRSRIGREHRDGIGGRLSQLASVARLQSTTEGMLRRLPRFPLRWKAFSVLTAAFPQISTESVLGMSPQ